MKIINEKLGVPTGIIKSSEILFDDIIKSLGKHGDFTLNKSKVIPLSFETSLNINEVLIKNVEIKLNIKYVLTKDKLVGGAGFMPKFSHDTRREFVSTSMVDINNIELRLDIYIPKNEELNKTELIDFLNENSDKIIASLSHELKHSYDFYKKRKTPIKSTIDYRGTINYNGFNLKPIKKFFFLVYLSTTIELLVKPTEVASRMSLNVVNKKQFLEFLLSDKTFEEFVELRDYTLEMLCEDLLKHYDEIMNALKSSNVEIPNEKSEVIKIFLNYVYYGITNEKTNLLQILVSSNNTSFEDMMGIDSDSYRGKMIKSLYNDFYKYRNNPQQYFANEILHFNKVGSKMVKKISKLYDMAQDSNETSDIIKKIYYKTNSK